jgi:hypothetical protein
MTSWVYIFSRFTPEALLFEALIIFALGAGYAGYWVLRKRRQGAVIGSDIPAGVVRTYLNELIIDAEQLRAQLFGLLASAGMPMHEIRTVVRTMQAPEPAQVAAPAPAGASAPDPELTMKLGSLEGKLAEQMRAMETLLAEKTRLEHELSEAKLGAQAMQGGATDGVELAKLREKMHLLESKLAEYSVIEDDLANLKRLQQENAQLRAALAAKGGSAEAALAAAPAPAAAAPVAAEPEPEPALEPEAPAAEAAPDAGFEGLVDHVEESLKEAPPAPEPPAPVAAAPVPAPAPPAPAPAQTSNDKSDADLVAEFEKMLHG